MQGDALHLPFADATFDRVIGSEVLEHIPDDVAAPWRELARVLRPGRDHGRHRAARRCPSAVNWALSDAYHNVPGGHVRIYRRRCSSRAWPRWASRVVGHHYAHGLHSPYWWLKCLVGTTNDTNWLVSAYHRLLVWDIVKAPRTTALARARALAAHRQVARRLPGQAGAS